ncbi:hypothetical protein ACWDWU_17580 [Streptomyces sp. NPDC003442]
MTDAEEVIRYWVIGLEQYLEALAEEDEPALVADAWLLMTALGPAGGLAQPVVQLGDQPCVPPPGEEGVDAQPGWVAGRHPRHLMPLWTR